MSDNVVVRCELKSNGKVEVKANIADAAAIVLVLERAKLDVLIGLNSVQASQIYVPDHGIN